MYVNEQSFTSFVCEIKVDALLLHAQVSMERVLCREVLEGTAAATADHGGAAHRGGRLGGVVLRLILALGPRVAEVVLTPGLKLKKKIHCQFFT